MTDWMDGVEVGWLQESAGQAIVTEDQYGVPRRPDGRRAASTDETLQELGVDLDRREQERTPLEEMVAAAGAGDIDQDRLVEEIS